MKVSKINLVNFRGFEQLEFGLERDVNVIAGENGIGKSSILCALTKILSHLINDFTAGRVERQEFSNSDIRRSPESPSNWLHASGYFELGEAHFDFGIERSLLTGEQQEALIEEIVQLERDLLRVEGGNKRDRDKMARKIRRDITSRKQLINGADERSNLILAGIDVPGIEFDPQAPDRSLQEYKSALKKRPAQPIAVFFSTKRFFNDSIKKIPKSPPFTLQRAYSNALEDLDVSLSDFAHWFHFASKSEAGSKISERMVEVITEFVPTFSNLRIEESGGLKFLVDKGDVTLPLTELSDGERGLIAMVFDLARRLVLANPDSDDPIAEGEGIILIDEIELHLHPKWQREVLGRFSSTFKNCQFIVTTHSPQVIGEVDARSIRFLERDKDSQKITVWRPTGALGLDSNRVLDELMGVSERNQRIQKELDHLFELIDNEKFDEAREAMNPLAQLLGSDEPELTRAKALIKFLEGEE